LRAGDYLTHWVGKNRVIATHVFTKNGELKIQKRELELSADWDNSFSINIELLLSFLEDRMNQTSRLISKRVRNSMQGET
jgi:hypothetical protein